GRAILLGEQVTPNGARYDIQLKGSGPTPYSRNGDGRAALGPMLREFIISEAMYALNIPTTRSLCVVTTGESVYRETALTGAVLTRVAASHLRVGTFEYFAMRRDTESLKRLVAYAIDRHYPQIKEAENPALALLYKVISQQINLICEWLRVGFIHGVMNTDNMTISGETIDYGPCAFMEEYDPATVFSSIDHRGRYSFGNQAPIAQWNLARFAEAILPLLHEDQDKAVELAEEAIGSFSSSFQKQYQVMMNTKFGLSSVREGDEMIVLKFLTLLQKHNLDYTNGFRGLSQTEPLEADIFKKISDDEEFQAWTDLWQQRIQSEDVSQEESLSLRQQANPAFIPRNQHVEEALNAAENGNIARFNKLLDVVTAPYQDRPDLQDYKQPMAAGSCFRTFCGT
ncbi:MAG: YdiU family protein, partial [Alphaproteobacteria bacterium]|nr:YdiU family protein [Alphaproteobacteria bacterium]